LLINLVQVHPWYVVVNNKNHQPEELASADNIEDILKSCKLLAEEINHSASIEYEKARQKGYADGFAAAKDEALEECLTLAESASKYVQQFDKEIVSLVIQAVITTLPMLSQESLLPSLVEQALAKVKIGKFLIFKCHPESIGALQPVIDQLKEDNPQLEHLKIATEPAFNKFECLLETGFGSVRTNVESILKLLSKKVDFADKKLPILDFSTVE
jgi:flagellar biosynthesis/type III secretory pathway protein FliH